MLLEWLNKPVFCFKALFYNNDIGLSCNTGCILFVVSFFVKIIIGILYIILARVFPFLRSYFKPGVLVIALKNVMITLP